MMRALLWIFFLAFNIASQASAQPTPVEITENFSSIQIDQRHYRHQVNNDGFPPVFNSLGDFSSWETAPAADSIDNYTRIHHWFSFDVINRSENHIRTLLEYRHSRVEILNVYFIKHGEVVTSYQTGQLKPFSTRAINNPDFLFPLAMAPEERVTVLVENVGRAKYMLSKVYLWDQESFLDKPNLIHTAVWFILGICSIMWVYNAFLGFYTRDVTYIWYLLWLLAFTLVIISKHGVGFQYLWPDNIAIEERVLSNSSYFSALFTGLFSVSFLQLRSSMPRMTQFIYFLCGVLALMIISNLITPHNETWHIRIAVFISLPFIILLWGVGVWLWWQGSTSAKFFVISWILPVCAGLITTGSYVARDHGLPLAIEVGNCLQLAFLSMAVGSRLESLRSSQYRAVSANLAKSDFLAKMSHEIRTPMNGVLGMSELLSSTPLNTLQQRYNKIIYDSGQGLLSILNDILDHSKIEAGKLDIESIPVDIRVLAEEVTELFLPAAIENSNKLSLQLSEDIPRFILSDPTRLRQFMSNLISNAMKFTRSGDVTLKIESIVGPEHDKILKISVSDTGVGIEEKKLHLLFEDFSQLDGSIAREFGGTGLGLSICKQLARLMGGDIGVESRVGEGSTFWVRVAYKSFSALLPEEQEIFSVELPILNILVADDNDVNRMVISGMLSKLNQNFTVFENGRELFDEYRAMSTSSGASCDLILMDCEMPVMDGFEATMAIRAFEEQSGVPCVSVVALTAHAMLEQRKKGGDCGMNEFLVKPLTLSDLRECLKKVAG